MDIFVDIIRFIIYARAVSYFTLCFFFSRGWKPSYRNVLLGVRKKLGVPCSSKLSTQDLEVEIFLHLLQEYSR